LRLSHESPEAKTKNFLHFGKRILRLVTSKSSFSDKMPILSANDIKEISDTWNLRRDDAFKARVTSDFVVLMLDHVPENLKSQLLWAVQNVTTPSHLQLGFGIQFDTSHTFTAEGWGNRKWSIKQVIYRTDALERIAREIGPNIKVTPHFVQNVVFFTIDFWPHRVYPYVVHDPEDVYADMPPLSQAGDP